MPTAPKVIGPTCPGLLNGHLKLGRRLTRSGTLETLPLNLPLKVEDVVDIEACKLAWARLLTKVYEVDPFICSRCGSEMAVIVIIENPDEIKRILRHLIKIGRSPPGFEPDRLN